MLIECRDCSFTFNLCRVLASGSLSFVFGFLNTLFWDSRGFYLGLGLSRIVVFGFRKGSGALVLFSFYSYHWDSSSLMLLLNDSKDFS
jgi:hypothetical protein